MALLLSSIGCAEEPHTQVVVLMDTDYVVPEEVDRIRARVSKVLSSEAGVEEIETWEHVFVVSKPASNEPGVHGLPATFGVLAEGAGTDTQILIELEAIALGSGRVLVSHRIRTGFVRGEARLARMPLFRACEGMTCSVGQSCGCPGASACAEPACVSEIVLPESLERIENPGLLPADAGIPPRTDGGMPDGSVDGGEPDAGTPDGGVINCEPPLLLCGMDCVNPQADPRYCGDCETSCPIGSVCETGSCFDPGDCRSNGVGCSGFTFCEEATGQCLPGCRDAQQCTGAHEECDIDTHECVCAIGFQRCEGACVDTQNDPSFCGDCTRSCSPPDVCESGTCVDPGDCRTNDSGCSGFTYCDESTGECLRGCESDGQCVGDNEICNTTLHECVCAPAFHRCGAVCVSNLDVDSCGASCAPCPAPPNSVATCASGSCGFTCDDTYEPCGPMCCPTTCPPGQVLYEQACARIHIQVVDEFGNVGEHSALALDDAGRAHIAYYIQNGRDLGHAAQQSNDSWLSEKPDSTGDVGQHASIAFSPSGVLHIAYYDATTEALMLASGGMGSFWSVEIVDDVGDVGRHASLAFDGDGNPHISYYEAGDKDLLHATKQGAGGWAVQVADADGDVGEYSSLAFDPSGAAHISYYDAGNADLKHAVQEPDGTWRSQTIASVGKVGEFTSLGFTPSGLGRIVFYDETNGDLRFASEAILGPWTAETVDSEGDVGKFASLAIDATGRARVGYYDETSGDLKYAVRSSGGWVVETVDDTGDVGQFASIAVDQAGHTHISYYDLTNTNLKYALIAGPGPSVP